MLYRSYIEGLLLEGCELICSTYESKRELIEACADDHEVVDVSYLGIYIDDSFETDDGLEVFTDDMVYEVVRINKGDEYNE